jgi:transcriptional regulator with XRE-family HTH domain
MDQPNVRNSLGIISRPEDLGAAVRRARLALGLTPEQAAERCGVATRTLTDLEYGAWDMTMSEAFDIINNVGLEVVMQPMGTAVMEKIMAGDPLEASSILDEYYGPERPWLFP